MNFHPTSGEIMTIRESGNDSARPFVQRCIEPDCGSSYGIDDRCYVCSRCGGLLEIERTVDVRHAESSLRAMWRGRMSSPESRDRSGVWRFRELLPFAESTSVVSLGEGNTPLYEAARSAGYCRLDSLKLKHQGNNPTGSFKDTRMTEAVNQASALRERLVALASHGN